MQSVWYNLDGSKMVAIVAYEIIQVKRYEPVSAYVLWSPKLMCEYVSIPIPK